MNKSLFFLFIAAALALTVQPACAQEPPTKREWNIYYDYVEKFYGANIKDKEAIEKNYNQIAAQHGITPICHVFNRLCRLVYGGYALSGDSEMKNDLNMEERVRDFLKIKNMALFGMSRDPEKFGNKVYKNLTAKGYKLFPIHPHPVQDEIEGIKCFKSIAELPEKVEGAIMVIPPPKTEKALVDIAKAGIKRVWMQPGAESEAGIKYCEENGIAVIYEECVMVRSSLSSNPFG